MTSVQEHNEHDVKIPMVVALELGKYSLDTSEKFGELVYLFDADEQPPAVWSDEYRQEIVKRLDDIGFDPELDYVAIVGKVFPLAILVNVLTAKYRLFRVLVFHANRREYEPVLFNGVPDA